MSDIKPIDIPTAAGVEFGRGDVRHFSEEDAVDVPGLQNPTRQLAERDNLIASKVNEVVSAVNNKEQFVPLVIPAVTMAPGTEERITNFSIPQGFEARILFANIGTNPASADVVLKIFYSTGYGNLTGTEIVSTSGAFSSGTSFLSNGEFIVTLRNNGSSTLESAASITLTIRPVGSQSSLLVGSIIQGKQGLIGGKGDKGGKGDPGVGGAGSPGIIWSGPFNSNNTYAPPQAVSFVISGGTESFISKILNPGPGSTAPPNTTYWDILVSSSSGLPGAVFRWNGPWNNATVYVRNTSFIDSVSYTSSGVTNTYIVSSSVSATTAGHDPVNFPGEWQLAVSSSGGISSSYNQHSITGTIYASSVYAVDSTNDGIHGYSSHGSPSSIITDILTFKEGTVSTATIGGLAFLVGQAKIDFTGSINVQLPTIATGARANWVNSACTIQASVHGFGTHGPAVNVYAAPNGVSAFDVVVTGTATPINVTINGVIAV